MIRILLYLVLLFGGNPTFCSSDVSKEWKVQGETYILQTDTVPNEDCCKDIVLLKVLRQEGSSQKLLLSFPLYRSYADGHYEEVELGKYRIEGNQLHLFTWWNFTGQDNAAPVGAKKMIYEVREDGKLYWKSGKIYLEEGDRGGGAGFLKYPVVSEEDQKQFQEYIYEVERKHLARFQFGADADSLFVEIRKELADKIAEVKGSWR